RPADDLLGELHPTARVRLDLEPDMTEHPVAAGLLLVAALDPGRAPDRLLVRDLGRLRHDRCAELALEPLADDRDVGLARRDEELLAGRGSFDARRGLLLEHPLE